MRQLTAGNLLKQSNVLAQVGAYGRTPLRLSQGFPARLWRSLSICLTAFIVLVACSSPASNVETHSALSTPDPRFGVVETYHAPDQATQAGVGWTRLIFYWSELERTGPDDWNAFHEPLDRIDAEIKGGREVVGMLQHTPAWATDGQPDIGVPRGLYLPVDDPGNLWAGFVRKVVKTYQGRITRWIIWNEPDIAPDVYGTQWAGTPADYYQLVKVAWLAAHEADPNVKIHLGGLTYWHDQAYLSKFLAAAQADPTAASHGDYFDVVSAHIYFKPETTETILGSIRDAMHKANIDKPIWINETNAPPFDDPTHPWINPVFPDTQSMQAAFLMQEFALGLVDGAQRIAVYKWIDQPPPQPGFDPYGLLRENGDPRPALAAFQVITRTYAGATSARDAETEKIHAVTLVRGSQTTRVLWSRLDDSVIVAVPALAGSAQVFDQTGAVREARPLLGRYILTLGPATCPQGFGCYIGGPPLALLEGAADRPAGEVIALTRTTLLRAGIGAGVCVLIGLALIIVLRRRSQGLNLKQGNHEVGSS